LPGQQVIVSRAPQVSESNRLNQIAEWPVEGVVSSIAVGFNGEVYINSNNNFKVERYSYEGERRGEFDVDEAIQSNGMAIGTDSDLYIILGDRLTRYNPSGEKLAEWPLHGLPRGMAAGPDEAMLVLFDKQVVAYGDEGQRPTELEVEAGAVAIASGPDGSIYIAYPQKVVRHSSSGQKQAEWMVEGANGVDGIAVDGRGQVYVTINNSHRVVSFSPAGEMLSQWDLKGNFSGLAVSPEGLIFAADVDASSMKVFQLRA
jgi:sugar lactone lactonase YvrE